MEKFCRFLKDVYDGDELIWEKDKEYLVSNENDEVYYFGEPIVNGIEKKLKNKMFKVVTIE